MTLKNGPKIKYYFTSVDGNFVDSMDSGRISNSNLQTYLITIRISNPNLKFSKFYESRISNLESTQDVLSNPNLKSEFEIRPQHESKIRGLRGSL